MDARERIRDCRGQTRQPEERWRRQEQRHHSIIEDPVCCGVKNLHKSFLFFFVNPDGLRRSLLTRDQRSAAPDSENLILCLLPAFHTFFQTVLIALLALVVTLR